MLTKERRFPELKLPEMSRDDIAKSISEIDVPEAISNIDWPKVEMPKNVDLGKAVSKAVSSVHIGPRKQPSRWPWAVGGLVVAGVVAGWVLLTNPSIRSRISSAMDAVRARIDEARMAQTETDDDDAIAFDAAETAPMMSAPFADPLTPDPSDYPPGLGSNDDDSNGDGSTADADKLTSKV